MSKNRNIGFVDSQAMDGIINGTSDVAHPPEMLPPSYDSIMRPPVQYGVSQPRPGTHAPELQASAPSFNTMPPYPTESHVSLSQPTSGIYNPMSQPASQYDKPISQISSQNYQPMSQSPYTPAYQATTYNPTIVGQVHAYPGNSNVIYVPRMDRVDNQSRNRKIKLSLLVILIVVIIVTVIIRRI